MQSIATACVAVLALQVVLLGFWVSILRGRTQVIYHGAAMPPDSALAKAVRAHGNAAEFAGILAALFIGISLLPAMAGTTWPSVLMLGITAARCLGTLGFLTCKTLDAIHPLKALSALCTYFGTPVLAGAVLVSLLR